MARDVALRRGGAADRPDRAPGEVQPARRGGVFGFIGESVAELKKVEWPSQQQVISGTAVVLIASIITGIYLYGNDELWSYIVKHVLLR